MDIRQDKTLIILGVTFKIAVTECRMYLSFNQIGYEANKVEMSVQAVVIAFASYMKLLLFNAA